MQDGQHGAVACRVREFVGMPTGGERSSLGLAVAHHATSDKIGIVENRTVSMRQRIAQFTAFMDGAGCLRSVVAGYASGKRELLEQLSHAFFVLLNTGIQLGVGAFQIGVRDHSWPAVPRTTNVYNIKIVFLDQAVEVYVDEVQPGRRTLVTEQPRLHVLKFQRLTQQRV